jgi:hypothetical protein
MRRKHNDSFYDLRHRSHRRCGNRRGSRGGGGSVRNSPRNWIRVSHQVSNGFGAVEKPLTLPDSQSRLGPRRSFENSCLPGCLRCQCEPSRAIES